MSLVEPGQPGYTDAKVYWSEADKAAAQIHAILARTYGGDPSGVAYGALLLLAADFTLYAGQPVSELIGAAETAYRWRAKTRVQPGFKL